MVLDIKPGQIVISKRKFARFGVGSVHEVHYLRNGLIKLKGYGNLFNEGAFDIAPEGVKLPKPDLLTNLLKQVNGKTGVCSYALEYEDGTERFQVRDICHARLQFGGWNDEGGKRKLKRVALCLQNTVKDEKYRESYCRFLEYMLNNSPWASAFETKYSPEVLNTGVYLDVTKPFSFVCAAAIALRTGHEYQEKLPLFSNLLDMRYSPNVAYIMSQIVTIDKGQSVIKPFEGGHHVFNSYMRMTDMASFFNNGVIGVEGNDVAYEDAWGRAYKIFLTMAPNAQKNQTSFMNQLIKDNPDLVKDHKVPWGGFNKVICVGKEIDLFKVCNTLAKVIK